MKKLISLSIIMALIVLSMATTAFAATGDALVGEGLQTSFVEDANGIITATVSFKGLIVDSTTIESSVIFDNAKVNPMNNNGDVISVTTPVTNIFDYVTLSSNLTLSDWKVSTATINIGTTATTKYVKFGIQPTGSAKINVASGVTYDLFTFRFKKTDNQVINNSTFTLKTSATNYAVYSSGGIKYYSGGSSGVNIVINVAKFAVLVTPYVAKYTVTFDKGGATGTTPTQVDTAANGQFPLPGKGDLEKAGHTFAGWKDQDNNSYSAGDTFTMPAKNVTLTAQWTPAITKYTVTFKDWDATTLKTEEVNSGSGATAPANPSRDRYTFTSWDKTFNNITADTIVTAQYTEKDASNLPINDAGSVVKKTETADVTYKVKNGENVSNETAANIKVVVVPAFAPVAVKASDCFDGNDPATAKFGIKLGTQYFPSALSWAQLEANEFRYFIRFVDTNPLSKFKGKTYQAKTYFNDVESTDSVNITIE